MNDQMNVKTEPESDSREKTTENLEYVKRVLGEAEQYDHAARVLMFDQETICPADAMEEQGRVMAFLSNQSYKLIKDPAVVEAAENLYAHRDRLGERDSALAGLLHRA